MPPTLPPMPPNLQGLTIAWYRESDWARWAEMDQPAFQPGYQHWLRRSEAALQHYRAAGVPVIKVTIDPDEFLAWSTATGKGVDSQARTLYATIAGMRKDKSTDA